MTTSGHKLRPGAVASWALAISIAITIIPAAILWLLRGRFPDPIAVHWGAGGGPDGWMSLGAGLLVSIITLGFLSCMMIGIGVVSRSITLLAPITIGMAVAMGVLIHGSMFAQIDGTEPMIGPYLFVGVLLWLVIAIAGYRWLQPRMVAIEPGRTGTFAPAAPGDPAVRSWKGRTRGGNGLWVVAALIVATGIIIALLIGFEDPWLTAGILLITVGVAPLALSALQEITIDHAGVTGKCFGIRATHIPLEAIRSAGHIEVQALGEYGGVGFRTAIDGDREGLVTASGEALIVEREGRKDFVITVDDARPAARVLATLLAARS